jgi:hypothetical protein
MTWPGPRMHAWMDGRRKEIVRGRRATLLPLCWFVVLEDDSKEDFLQGEFKGENKTRQGLVSRALQHQSCE